MEKPVGKMLAWGLIQPSTSPFLLSVLLAKKKDVTWHFYMDYRALNAITIKDHFLIPTVDELTSAYFFSKLDLCAGYHQVRLHPQD